MATRILIVFCLLSNLLFSQDVEKLASDAKNLLRQDPLLISGGLNASMALYDAKGMKMNRDPFYWSLNGNLNLSLYGKISCPLSFTLTQQDKQFSNGLDRFNQPFNQFGISPHYKWLTVHAGYRSMEFSEHSLSGALFLGGGVEIAPTKGIISGSVAFGRFLRAIPQGGVDGVSVSLPSYERWGGAAKLKVGKEKNYIEFIYFKATDKKESIPFDTSTNVLPADNQIFGLKFMKSIGEKLSFQGAYHYSMFTPNTYLPVSKIERFTYINKIFSPRANSRFNSSYNFQVDYEIKGYRIGAKFKRVDPDYASLGAVFITNDVQEFSGTLSKPFLKNRVNVNLGVGTTRNNLDRNQIATQRRLAMNGSVNISLIKNLSISVSYNSFSTDVVAIRDVFYDSIRLSQVNETGTLNINYNLGKDIRHTFSANTIFQESGGNKQPTNSIFMLNPSYNVNFTKYNVGMTLAGAYTLSEAISSRTENFGPTVGVNTSFFKNKVKVGVNGSYQSSKLNKVLSNKNYALTSFLNYTLTKSQSLKINYAFINKVAVVAGAQDFVENRLTIAYSYTFNTSYRKIKELIKAKKKDE
ncbi:hypothetical protein D3C71_605510 [compost metagenome]